MSEELITIELVSSHKKYDKAFIIIKTFFYFFVNTLNIRFRLFSFIDF